MFLKLFQLLVCGCPVGMHDFKKLHFRYFVKHLVMWFTKWEWFLHHLNHDVTLFCTRCVNLEQDLFAVESRTQTTYNAAFAIWEMSLCHISIIVQSSALMALVNSPIWREQYPFIKYQSSTFLKGTANANSGVRKNEVRNYIITSSQPLAARDLKLKV